MIHCIQQFCINKVVEDTYQGMENQGDNGIHKELDLVDMGEEDKELQPEVGMEPVDKHLNFVGMTGREMADKMLVVVVQRTYTPPGVHCLLHTEELMEQNLFLVSEQNLLPVYWHWHWHWNNALSIEPLRHACQFCSVMASCYHQILEKEPLSMEPFRYRSSHRV